MEQKNFFQRNWGWILVVVVVLLCVNWVWGQYNTLVVSNEKIDSQWAQIDNQLQRRFDLIPNVVNTVKGVSKQEQDVFGAIAEARTRYSGAVTSNEKAQAANQVESALGRLLVIAENYPQLQSSQAYRDLMVTLEGTENRLSVERKNYNDMVKEYNVEVKRFPASLIARLFGFEDRAYFEVQDSAKVNPTVDFSN
ncbi:MAG: LemA protein [Patescibacteria group bacterium]|jgi:LemA protein|nr:LemA protein [Patescibacteria group bacterium]